MSIKIYRTSPVNEKVMESDKLINGFWRNLVAEVEGNNNLPVPFSYEAIKEVAKYGDIAVRGSETFLVAMFPM